MAEINLNIGTDSGKLEGSGVDVGTVAGGDIVNVGLPGVDGDMSNSDRKTLEELKSEVRELVKVVSALVVAIRGNTEFSISGLIDRVSYLETKSHIVTMMLFLVVVYVAAKAYWG